MTTSGRKPDSHLEAALNKMQADSKSSADADISTASADTRRPWMLLGLDEQDVPDGTLGMLFEFDAIHDLLDRNKEAGDLYKKTYSEIDDSKASLAVAANIQSDFLSGLERDFRHRHRPALRARVHAAAAKSVAGAEKGTISILLRYVSQALREADTDVRGPDDQRVEK